MDKQIVAYTYFDRFLAVQYNEYIIQISRIKHYVPVVGEVYEILTSLGQCREIIRETGCSLFQYPCQERTYHSQLETVDGLEPFGVEFVHPDGHALYNPLYNLDECRIVEQ